MKAFIPVFALFLLVACRSNEQTYKAPQVERDVWAACEAAKYRAKVLVDEVLAKDPDKGFEPAFEMGKWLGMCGPSGQAAKDGIEKAAMTKNGPDIILLEKALLAFAKS